MGAGAGIESLKLNLRIQEAKAKQDKEQHDRAREVVKDEKDKADAQRADRRIDQKDIDQWIADERRASAETDALLKRDKAFAQDREEPAYRIAIHELNVFDPDFPSHLFAVNARYPNISVTDEGRLIASIKMADAGMEFDAHGIKYIPGKLQDKYRKAEEALGFHELRDLATYSRSTGKFLEIDAFEVDQRVLEKRVKEARKLAIPGEDFTINERGGVTIRGGTPPPKQADPAKEASEKAKAAASSKRFVAERRIRQNDNELHSLRRELYALELRKVDAEDEAEIKAHSNRIKEITADNDRLLREMETPDSPAPPPPTEQKKPAEAPPATTGTPVNPATAPATGAGTSPVPAETRAAPAAPAKKRIPFTDRLKEPPSQPQASAAPDMNALTASARDFSSFSGRREEIESNPDLSAEFDAAAESMSQMLQSLGYDEAASAASGGYVADGSTIEFEKGEDGEPAAVTVAPDGTRTPLEKAASAATASIDSPRAAS